MIDDIRLDHVALATDRPEEGYSRYAGDLAGRWGHGGDTPGFTSYQIVYANEMRVEIISPFRVEENDFMRRFMDRNGPGPHHLTFKVGDLAQALDVVREGGYNPVGVDLSNLWWQEAFLHPKDAPGIVVQLAHSAHEEGEQGEGEWFSPEPAEFPAGRTARPADLVHVAHAVADLPAALALFSGLLGGREAARGEAGGVRWVDLVWPGPGRIRLLTPVQQSGAVQEWLGGRAGRLHHLAFACEGPGQIPDARATTTPDVLVVAPEDNRGVCLLLAESDAAFRDVALG